MSILGGLALLGGMSAATSVGSAVGGGLFTSAKKQYKYNSKLSQLQADLNMQAYKTQLADQERVNSPAYMMQKYQEAGVDINPQALVNNGASMGMSTPTLQPANSAPAPADYQQQARDKTSLIQSSLQNFIQLRTLKNNTDEVGARVLDVMSMNELRSVQKLATITGNKKLGKEIEGIILDNKRKEIENEYLPSIQIANLQDIRSQIDYRIKQGELTDAQTANAYKTLDKIDAEIDNLRQNYRESESRVGWQNRRNQHYDDFGTDIGTPNAWSQGQGVVGKIVKGVKPLYDKADSLYPGFRGNEFGSIIRGGALRGYGNYLKSKGKNLH